MTISSIRARRAAPACLRPAVLALAVAAALPVLAQQPAPVQLAQNTYVPALRETVVTATRTAQPLSDLVADVSIVDRETIDNSGATGLVDVLARLPGVEISRSGGVGNASNVFLRGAEGRFTAVYIDGVRVDSQSTGGAVWEQIPLSQIDRIEVLRGPAAAVYGSDAIGGVIQLFTRKGEGPAAPYVGIGLGTDNLRRIEAGVSGSAGEGGAFDYALGITREQSDGYDIRNNAGHNPDRDGYSSTAGHARLGFKVNARHRLDATLVANRLESGFDVSPSPVDDRNHNRMRTAGLTWSAQWTEAFNSRLSVTDSMSRYETTPSPYLTETRLRGYLWQNEYRVGAHLFTAALERREDHLVNAPIDQGRSQDALALGYGFNAGGHTLQLNVRHDSDSEFGGKGTGSVAYGYALTPAWRATASAGTAFRAPTLYQRFSEYGVATLVPESSRNAELGLRWAQGSNSFSVVAYRNRVQNLISFGAPGPCASSFGCYENTARAEYKGVTLAGAYKLAGVQLRGSIDWQRPRDLDTGKLVARRAKHHATFGADTLVAGWTLGAEVQASGQRFDNAANTNVLGGYGLVSLYASKRVAREFTLLARVDNLSDKVYELARTYVTPGRTLFVGLKWAPQL
ncbi:TonB-dependent receptor domain-containing protein [Acidovorax sp. SRB_24]|uniref:TonB-dependent receptor domain-containing protein n=1 Tax=Acidovorax sp. SRB_24 TaxID=1962700 RepID=UPI00145D7AF4|nr:TonB-dependent receptor [Acidovorax sp. SRB_24]NMM76166.1 TonB-dependent receptor [Acidovorax sp. SRB_24]